MIKNKVKTLVIDGDWLAFVGACLTHIPHLIAVDKQSRTRVILFYNREII